MQGLMKAAVIVDSQILVELEVCLTGRGLVLQVNCFVFSSAAPPFSANVSAAYYDYQAEVIKNTPVDGLSTDVQDQGTTMPPRGIAHIPVPLVPVAPQSVLNWFYRYAPPAQPFCYYNPSKIERNKVIRLRHSLGVPINTLADEFNLSNKRVYQIIHRQE